MLNTFRILNYKCLKKLDLRFTDIHVLIGKNDTGKSSVLEAIKAFCYWHAKSANDMLQRTNDAFPKNCAGIELVNNTSQSRDVSLIGTTSRRTGQSGSLDSIEVCYEVQEPQNSNVTFFGPTHSILLKQLLVNGQQVFVTSGNMGSSPRVTNQNEVKLATGSIPSAAYFRLSPKVMSIPSALLIDKTFGLQEDGFGLATLIDEIIGHDTEAFSSLQNDFRKLFPHFRRIKLETVVAPTRQSSGIIDFPNQGGIGKEIRLTTDAGDIRLQQASDGAILILGFLALCYSPNSPDIILIEEPENGIHPKRLKEIAGLFKQFVKNSEKAPQIIFTTHSPYLLSDFEPDEVTLMFRRGDGTIIARRLSEAPNIEKRMEDGFFLGELWYNLSEEELFGDVG